MVADDAFRPDCESLPRGDRGGRPDDHGAPRARAASGDNPGRRALARVRCGCGRRIHIAPGVLASGAVLCGVCGELFTPGETRIAAIYPI